jgi:hypothetical protein
VAKATVPVPRFSSEERIARAARVDRTSPQRKAPRATAAAAHHKARKPADQPGRRHDRKPGRAGSDGSRHHQPPKGKRHERKSGDKHGRHRGRH